MPPPTLIENKTLRKFVGLNCTRKIFKAVKKMDDIGKVDNCEHVV